jgi:hypothetical protein
MGLLDGILGFMGARDTNNTNSNIADANNSANAANTAVTNQANIDIASRNNDTAIGIANQNNATAMGINSANNAQTIQLANTAHQREVADLKAAGLNPILSVNKNGAATPSLSAPQLQAPQLHTPTLQTAHRTAPQYHSAISGALASAFEAKRIENDSSRVDNETKSTEASIANTLAQTAQTQLNMSQLEKESEFRIDALDTGNKLNLAKMHESLGIDAKNTVETNWLQMTGKSRHDHIKAGINSLNSSAALNNAHQALSEAELPGATNQARFETNNPNWTPNARAVGQVIGSAKDAAVAGGAIALGRGRRSTVNRTINNNHTYPNPDKSKWID